MTFTLLLALSAHAELPLPTFPDCAEDNPAACPSDLDDWELLSWIPDNAKTTVRRAERSLGSGISADIAFRYSTGRWEVPIAILDSGIYWQEAKLLGKIHLNDGELPRPQDASGAEIDDLDGNGILNIWDYADDPRVDITAGVDEADALLDPSDLIYTFSDGVDDDGNGYIDDIAGWDFFGNDNDPFAELQAFQAEHGTGVMTQAAQGGNDGSGIGVCPNCSVIPVRLGDAFVVTGDRVGLGVAYATDAGARVIGMAVGALTHPELASEAIHYADRSGVVLVGAAGDENSYHHNFPAVADPILYVHSIRSNTLDEGAGDIYSFMSLWNCNNFGPRLDLVAPAEACATGAVAATAGSAGLLISAGIDNGLQLSTDEVKALLRTTVDDVDLSPAEQAEARAYPSGPGWDGYFGYGRVNIGRAVQQVFEGQLPPVARIDSPSWFSWVRPDGPALEVRGLVDAPRGKLARWLLETGRGMEPSEWTEVASGNTASEGLLATLDPSAWGDVPLADLDDETLLERVDRAHRPLVTLRLTVTDRRGLQTEVRRGVWSRRDPDLLPGFPMSMGASLESAPILIDFDGDGVFEVVVAASQGVVHVLRGDGSELPGFPVHTDLLAPARQAAGSAAFRAGALTPPYEGILAGAAAGDLDGDGVPELVVASLPGKTYAWHADGSLLDGFPVSIEGRRPEEFGFEHAWENGVASTPALGDIDGDGALEIIGAGMDQRLYAWDHQGRLLPGYPLELCEACGQGARILSSPALGDIDADGDLDALIGTNELPVGAAGVLFAVDLSSAKIWPGWPLEREGLINQSILPVIGEGHPSSPSLADVDGDGALEFASTPMLASTGILHYDFSDETELSYTLEGYGTRSNVYDGAFLAAVTNPSFGDLNGDGRPEFLLGGPGVQWPVSLALGQYYEYQHMVGAWDLSDPYQLVGFPRQVDDIAFLVAPTIADISGDGRPEVLYATGGFVAYAWDALGDSAPGWPKFTGGWSLSSPAIGDITGDGRLDVVLTTREGLLFAWSTAGRADQQVQWASGRHDAQNTGNYETPLPQQAGPAAVAEEPGGCCNKKGKGQAVLWFLPGLLWWRRRGAAVGVASAD